MAEPAPGLAGASHPTGYVPLRNPPSHGLGIFRLGNIVFTFGE